MGLPTAIIYLVALFLFVPFPFMSFFNGDAVLVHEENPTIGTFPYHKVSTVYSRKCRPDHAFDTFYIALRNSVCLTGNPSYGVTRLR
jgi:hypothetical protein